MADERAQEDTPLPVAEAKPYPGPLLLPNQVHGVGRTKLGFFKSMPGAAGTAWLDVKQRWSSLADSNADPTLTPAAAKEIMGDRAIPIPRDGLTRRELDRRVLMHDRDLHMSQYDTNLGGEIVGGAVPYLLDPVSLATMPVGGANVARAVGARTVSQFVKQTAIAGAKTAAAELPLELYVQDRTRGIDPTDVAMSSLAAFALPTVLTGATRAFKTALQSVRGLRNPPQSVAEAAEIPGSPPRDPHLVDQSNATVGPIEAPPVRVSEEGRRSSVSRLDEVFQSYEGGWQKWAQEAAVGVPRAAEFLRAEFGAEANHPAVRQLLAQATTDTALSMRRSPGDLQQLSQAVQEANAGRLTAVNAERLRRADMLDADGQVKPEFRGVGTQTQASRAFFQGGPEAVWVRELMDGQRQYDAAFTVLENKSPKTKAYKKALNDLATAQTRIDGALAKGSLVGDGALSLDMLGQMVDVLRRDLAPSHAKVQELDPIEASIADGILAREMFDDPTLEADIAFAKSVGLTDDEIAAARAGLPEVRTAMKECRSN